MRRDDDRRRGDAYDRHGPRDAPRDPRDPRDAQRGDPRDAEHDRRRTERARSDARRLEETMMRR